MSLCLEAACKLSYWSECLGKKRAPSQAPKTALKLFVSVPSLLQAHPSIDTVMRASNYRRLRSGKGR